MAQLALITDRYNAGTPKRNFFRPGHDLYSNSKSKTIHNSLSNYGKPRGLLGFPIAMPLYIIEYMPIYFFMPKVFMPIVKMPHYSMLIV